MPHSFKKSKVSLSRSFHHFAYPNALKRSAGQGVSLLTRLTLSKRAWMTVKIINNKSTIFSFQAKPPLRTVGQLQGFVPPGRCPGTYPRGHHSIPPLGRTLLTLSICATWPSQLESLFTTFTDLHGKVLLLQRLSCQLM